MKTLKDRYLYLIKLKDVTPYEVGKASGVEQSTLSHIKLEKIKKISNSNAKKLAEYFGVDKNWLLTGEGVNGVSITANNKNGHQNINGTQIISDQSHEIELLKEKNALLEEMLADKNKIIALLEKKQTKKQQ